MEIRRNIKDVQLKGYNSETKYIDLDSSVDKKDLVYAKKLIGLIPLLFHKVKIDTDTKYASYKMHRKYRNMMIKYKCEFDVDEMYFMSLRTVRLNIECIFAPYENMKSRSEKLSCVFDFANSSYAKLLLANLQGIQSNSILSRYFLQSPAYVFNVIFSECNWLLCSSLNIKEVLHNGK